MDRHQLTTRQRYTITLSVAALLTIIVCAAPASQSERYGPIDYPWHKNLNVPYPDTELKDFLHKYIKNPTQASALSLFPPEMKTGDVITVCNQRICVDYTLNSSKSFEGGNVRQIQQVGGGGGAGDFGGGSGGGGSWGDGVDWGGGGSGRVIVGPVEQA